MYKRNKETLILTPDQGEGYRKKLAWGKPIALFSYMGLVGLISVLSLQTPVVDWPMLFLKLVPLLIFIPGLIQQTFRTYSWLCFVCLVYFVVVMTNAYARSQWSDWLMTFLVTSLFISSMMTSRWMQYHQYFLSQQKTGFSQKD